jgi:hypothetical protein
MREERAVLTGWKEDSTNPPQCKPQGLPIVSKATLKSIIDSQNANTTFSNGKKNKTIATFMWYIYE